MENVHATCVDMNGAGVLITGASGSGKSDLALRLIENKGAVLVADDRTNLFREGENLTASSPEAIQGLMEVRGVGIVKKEFKSQTYVKLVVIAASKDKIERLPAPQFFENQGISLPSILLDLSEPSAPDKVVVKLKSVLEEAAQRT